MSPSLERKVEASCSTSTSDGSSETKKSASFLQMKRAVAGCRASRSSASSTSAARSEEHTSELQSQSNLVCRLLLEKKKKERSTPTRPPVNLTETFSYSSR